MLTYLAFCEPVNPWNPQLQLWSLSLFTISTGAIGMLSARRRPILSAPFIFFVLLSAFAVYLELRDSHFGPSILRVVAYILGSAVAVLAGAGLSVLGALVGANKMDERRGAWRWTLGGSGMALLGLTLFAVFELVTTVYTYLNTLAIQKHVRNQYAVQVRWQDVLPDVFTACVLIGLLILAAYLLRSAFRPATPTQIPANS